jgi:hypothetical protein
MARGQPGTPVLNIEELLLAKASGRAKGSKSRGK